VWWSLKKIKGYVRKLSMYQKHLVIDKLMKFERAGNLDRESEF
jgi:hypothetical protein